MLVPLVWHGLSRNNIESGNFGQQLDIGFFDHFWNSTKMQPTKLMFIDNGTEILKFISRGHKGEVDKIVIDSCCTEMSKVVCSSKTLKKSSTVQKQKHH